MPCSYAGLCGWLLAFAVSWQVGTPVAHGQQVRFETEVNLVLCDVAVVDRETSRPIADLKRQDFIILDQDVEREVRFFQPGVKALDLVFLLDASSRLVESAEDYTDAVAAAVESIAIEDQVAIMSFASKPRLVAPFTSNPYRINEALREIMLSRKDVPSRARILDAIVAAGKLFPSQERDPRRRRAILTITHNAEPPNERKRNQVIAQLLEADVTLHGMIVERFDLWPGVRRWTVWLPPSGYPIPTRRETAPTERVPRPELYTIDPIVAETGGELIREGGPLKDHLMDAFGRLRLHYVLGFHGLWESTADNNFRRLRIELTEEARARYPGALVRHRQRYFTNLPR